MTEEYYEEEYLEKFESQISRFKEENCDDFSLTDYEKENVPTIESINKYEKCEQILTYQESFFDSKIKELENYQNTYSCLDNDVYQRIRQEFSDYKTTYYDLKTDLTNSFNEIDDSSPNEDDSKETIEAPDYKIDKTSIAEICSSPSYRNPARFIGIVINFIKIIVPIVIVAFGAYDLFKAITGNKDEDIKVAMKSIAVRIIAGVFIFLIPGIIQLVMNLVNEWSGYKNSWCCCTECILNSNCDTESCSSDSCRIEGTN